MLIIAQMILAVKKGRQIEFIWKGAERLDLENEIKIDGETQERQGEACLEPVRLKNLRVLVFVNTTKAAEEAYNFLNGTAEQGQRDSVPWKHVILNDQTITIWLGRVHRVKVGYEFF